MEQLDFDNNKYIVIEYIILAEPDFDNVFYIHTDVCGFQVGRVISQFHRPIEFYRHRLTGT